jgi:nicotinamidase-related amidase
MKRILLVLLILITSQGFAQKLDSTALILIDIQYFYFPDGDVPLVEPEAAALQAQKVLTYFRENEGLVVHVKHAYEPGGDIHTLVKPAAGEKVFTKKEVNAFLGTGLDDYLKSNDIKYLVLVGMQTHMCLEGGTRAAHDLGYKCTVIGDACATRDLKFGDTTVRAAEVHASTLATLKSYARVLTASDFLSDAKR